MSATNVVYLQNEQQEALDVARYLAGCGVPLFIAKPALDERSHWVPDGGQSGTGYIFPKGWQHAKADPHVVDRWRQGDALCAVMGHIVDGLDVDPRHGGDRSLEHLKSVGAMPAVYGVATTPSAGTHHLTASLGVRQRDGLLPGIDYKAGVPSVGGHGFLFLAPTVKLSKVTGEPESYRWLEKPDLSVLELVGMDLTGGPLRRLLTERTKVDYDGPTYAGRKYSELTEAERAWADEELASLREFWAQLLAEAEGWPEGQRDERGRGWETLVRDWAWVCARLAVTPWAALSTDEAAGLYTELVPEAMAESVGSKWDNDLLAKAAGRPVEPPPWDGLTVLRDQSRVDATNPAKAAEWLRTTIGAEGTPLAGLFRRGEDVVHTPRIDEDGYVPLSRGERDLDGPAQVRIAGVDRIQARIQFSYNVVKRVISRNKIEAHLFPSESVRVVMGDVYMAPNLRVLRGVTHTPMLRADGTVLDSVGYDEASMRLFLPEAGLTVGEVPERPTVVEIAAARELLLEMIADFPFNTAHDRANYLAMLLTPLLRELVPPPYKLGALNAHQPGSGKSLLAWVLRTIHGGVLRGDVPRDGDEFRKQITSVLSSTTAPVVQFDNVRHLEASQLDALLTSDTWTDRLLGATREVTSRNDRLWVATGNNITLGGDLVRRVLWCSIDPRTPHPERRTDFAISDLKAWVREHRGSLLMALLTLVRAWVVEGRPLGAEVGSDDFAMWVRSCRGVLAVAGIDGEVEHQETIQQTVTDEGDEMVDFYGLLFDRFGTDRWLTTQVVDLMLEDGPDGLNLSSARSLGKWLTNRQGRWFGEFCVRQSGVGPDGRAKMWRVERYG